MSYKFCYIKLINKIKNLGFSIKYRDIIIQGRNGSNPVLKPEVN